MTVYNFTIDVSSRCQLKSTTGHYPHPLTAPNFFPFVYYIFGTLTYRVNDRTMRETPLSRKTRGIGGELPKWTYTAVVYQTSHDIFRNGWILTEIFWKSDKKLFAAEDHAFLHMQICCKREVSVTDNKSL